MSFTGFLSSLTEVPKAHFNFTFPINLLIPDITQSAPEADTWDTHWCEVSSHCPPPAPLYVPIQILLNISAFILGGYIFVVNLQLWLRRR